MSERNIIDADGHVWEDLAGVVACLPQTYREQFEKGRLLPQIQLFPPLDHFHSMPTYIQGFSDREDKNVTPEGWLAFIEGVGIERSVLYPTSALAFGQFRDRDYSVAVAQAYNTWLAQTYVDHPSGRFSGMAVLPMLAPERAAKELRRSVTELGLSGATIASNGLPTNLGSPEYWPVYAEAEALGVPLSFHGGTHSGLGFDDINMHAAMHALGHPFGLMITLTGLLTNRVYERFPNLRTAYLEGGSAWLLMAMERLSESFKAFSTYDRSGDVLVLPEGRGVDDVLVELMSEGRMMLGCEGGEHDIAYIVENLGFAPFMYSSDFPHEVDVESCKHEIEELDETGLTDDIKDQILQANARTFYGI